MRANTSLCFLPFLPMRCHLCLVAFDVKDLVSTAEVRFALCFCCRNQLWSGTTATDELSNQTICAGWFNIANQTVGLRNPQGLSRQNSHLVDTNC